MKIDIKTPTITQVRKFAKKYKLDKRTKDELMTICVASYIKGANSINGSGVNEVAILQNFKKIENSKGQFH